MSLTNDTLLTNLADALFAAMQQAESEAKAKENLKEFCSQLMEYIKLNGDVTVTIGTGVVSQGVSPSVILNPAPIPVTGGIA